MRSFAARVVAWQRKHGRSGLPWQGRDPYRVWLSEVMLQQTQVSTVIPYYERFLKRFPDLSALAQAPLDDVMRLWAGLGYYSRARNLHAAARRIEEELGGAFPRSAEAIVGLPGIGRSTAAAIAAFCFDERVPILDGNVKRVLARHAGIAGDPSAGPTQVRLWEHARGLLPVSARMPAYTQGLMDLGATTCVRARPGCTACPVRTDCYALRHDRIDQLPTPRKRKAAPTRRACILLAVAGDAVLLEQRPPTGIWGGLLAPPQYADARALRRALESMSEGTSVRAMPKRTLGFSHFTLAFTPFVATLDAVRPGVQEPGHRWVSLDRLADVALPAPMQSLLVDLRAQLAQPPRRRKRSAAT